MTIDIQAARPAFRARQEKNFKQREAAREEALRAVRAVAPEIVAGYPAVKTAYLFGSILRSGAFRSDSDIDIAIEGGSAEDYFALWHALEDALPNWFIDLRDLPPNTRFTQRVRDTGEKIYG
jgi:predicted nucleotidyltransferase